MIRFRRIANGFVVMLPLLSVAGGGCAPGVRVDVPEFHGRVVDAESRPVMGATVRLSRQGQSVAVVTSKPDGTFSHPEESRWVAYFGGADAAVQIFSVNAAMGTNRAPETKIYADFRTWMECTPVTNDLGDLHLR